MSDTPTLIVVNPTATRARRSGVLDQIRQAGQAPDITVLETDGVDHAREFCRRHARDFGKIVVAGGDGLLNEVVDGTHGADIAIGPLPAGSGNDFVKALPGYPVDLDVLLATSETMPADVGRITFTDGTVRHFASEAGAGMDAACVRLMPKWLNRINPAASYNIGGIRAILSYKPFGAAVVADGLERRFERIHMLCVANTTYFGDGMQLAPDARFDDGRFHLVIVKDISKIELLLRFKTIRQGTHVTHPLIVYEPCNTMTIEPDRALEMCIDGDYVNKTPARFDVLPGAMKLVRMA